MTTWQKIGDMPIEKGFKKLCISNNLQEGVRVFILWEENDASSSITRCNYIKRH